MHLSSFAVPVVVHIIVTFYQATRLLSEGYKVNRLSNTFKKFYRSTLILLDNTRQMSAKSLLILSVKNDFHFFMDLPWPN